MYLKLLSLKPNTYKKTTYQNNGLSFLGSLLRLFVFFLLVNTVLSDSRNQQNENILYGQTRATKAVIEGNVDKLKELYAIDPNLLRQVSLNGVTPATQAVLVEELAILKWLYAIDPALLRQIDQNGKTPATYAIENNQLYVLKFLYKLDPNLLSQVASGGVTPATVAAALGNLDALKLFHKLDPKLLDQIDRDGWTPATTAATLGQIAVLKALYDLDPRLLFREDGNGFTPAMTAAEVGQINVLKTLFKLNPGLVGFNHRVRFNLEDDLCIAATIALGYITLCTYVFLRIVGSRGPATTTINVHDGSRDNNALGALAKLKDHVGTLSKDYAEDVLLKDLNLKRLRIGDVDTLTNYYNKNRRALFYMKYIDEGKVKSLECVLDKIERTENGIQVQFYIVPEIGHLPKTDLETLTINPDKSVTYKTKSYTENLIGIYYAVQSSERSWISEGFEKNEKFRFALGFNTEDSDQIYKPFLFSSFQFLTPSGPVKSQEVIKLAHRFCKMEEDSNERMLKESAFIGGIKNGVVPRVQNEEQLYRLCENGQLQYLFTAVIQGRLSGVMIDDVSMAGLKDIIPSKDDLISECCREANHNKRVDSRADFEAFVKEYMRRNAFLSGDTYPQLKEEFQSGMDEIVKDMD